jgi:ankyrin repeat protein
MQLIDLPNEIIINTLLMINPININKSCKRLNNLVKANRIEIAYNTLKNAGMKINDKSSSYKIYKFYIDNKYKPHYINREILYKAIKTNNLVVVKYLVENDAKIKHEHNSILIHASKYGYLDIVKYLVEKGVYSCDDIDGALMFSIMCGGHLEVVKYFFKNNLISSSMRDYAFMEAASCGHLDIVKYTVNEDCNIQLYYKKALKIASVNKHIKVVKYLKSLKML